MSIEKEKLEELTRLGLTPTQIAKELNSYREYIKYLLYKYGFLKVEKYDENEVDKIRESINRTGCILLTAKEVGLNRNTIARKMKHYGISFSGSTSINSISKAHPNLNISYFKEINSSDKAYWLGFLYADGYVTKNGRSLILDLSLKDLDWLLKFCIVVGANSNSIRHRVHKKGYKSAKIIISKSKFTQYLVNHGCTNKKSKTIRLPKLNSRHLELCFLMGYYDGDGTSQTSNICCASLKFLEDIKINFNIENKVCHIKKNTFFNLTLGNKLKIEMEAAYPNSMERKKKILMTSEEIKEKRLNSLTMREIQIASRRVERPKMDSLFRQISDDGYEAVGRKYGVSGNAIRKWEKWYELHGD